MIAGEKGDAQRSSGSCTRANAFPVVTLTNSKPDTEIPKFLVKTKLNRQVYFLSNQNVNILVSTMILNLTKLFHSLCCSFDLRTQSSDNHGKIWASETNSEVTRAQLHIHSEPTAVLALHGVAQEDAGTYRCRVDFKRSPTRYRKITLDVIGELFPFPFSTSLIKSEK